MARNAQQEYKHKYYLTHKDKMKAFQKARYLADPEAGKLRVRKRRLRLYFPDLTPDQAYEVYQQMILAQGNVCAICKLPETKRDSQRGKSCTLAVDHCHSTGKVRGLLCFRCNINLGWYESMKDSFLSYLRGVLVRPYMPGTKVGVMVPAGVLRLYEQGLLCSCYTVVLVEKGSHSGTILERELIHDKECAGKGKVKEMLGLQNGKD